MEPGTLVDGFVRARSYAHQAEGRSRDEGEYARNSTAVENYRRTEIDEQAEASECCADTADDSLDVAG